MEAVSDIASSSGSSTLLHQNVLKQPSQCDETAGSDENSLKRTYLRLLPPPQLIELCLRLNTYVPVHVKSTIWPVDLHSAIAALQLEASALSGLAKHPTSSASVPPPNGSTDNLSIGSHSNDPPPMASLQSAAFPASPYTWSPVAQKPATTTTKEDGQAQRSLEVQNKSGSSHPSTPVPFAQPIASSSTYRAPAQPPYPHIPYGYHPQQTAYPQLPYYSHPPPGYPPQYVNHPTAYPSFPPPGVYGPNSHPTQPFSPAPPGRHPHHEEQRGVSGEDLPSYEDMIVESLVNCTDPEGLPPKNMFSWMAAHYPLQSNFRPSASQALQKAFKRGRLEKSGDGKYRINAAWEGGSTSRRTTRRPQTQSQVAHIQEPHLGHGSKSPFTHAPLMPRPTGPNGNSTPVSSNAPAHSSSPHPYTYHAGGYPGYEQYLGYPPPSTTSQPQAGSSALNAALSSAIMKASENEPAEMQGDAWEAAQNILKAINFGSLVAKSTSNAEDASLSSGHTPSITTREANLTSAVGDGLGNDRSAPDLTDEARAALQAQLALLAAQLGEIADVEEALVNGMDTAAAATTDEGERSDMPNEEDQDDEDEDEDEDMEMVDVPTHTLRTH